VRFSWSTTKTILDNKQCSVDWKDPKIEENGRMQTKLNFDANK
jgi:hypothetical protein